MFFGININEVFLFKEGEDCAFMEQKNIKLKKKVPMILILVKYFRI